MTKKQIIIGAKVLSAVFSPFYLPVVGLVALFFFSYMSLLPLRFKLFVLILVSLFTVVFPRLLIRLYRRYQGWTLHEMGRRERRMVPYVISILCYFACYYVMAMLHIPSFLGNILVAALLIQVGCAIINVWWKISTHTAAIGGLCGGLLGFANLLTFNPVWWLCVLLILAGLVGSSRMILRQHSLAQVVAGFFIGVVVAAVVI